jgi:hypothetical protein
MVLDVGYRALQLTRGEPTGHRTGGLPSHSILTAEGGLKHSGQWLASQLPSYALAFKRGLQHQRKVLLQRLVGGKGGRNRDTLHLQPASCVLRQRRHTHHHCDRDVEFFNHSLLLSFRTTRHCVYAPPEEHGGTGDLSALELERWRVVESIG